MKLGIYTSLLVFFMAVTRVCIAGLPELDRPDPNRIGVPFVANEGQMDEEVLYYTGTFGGTVFITKSGEIVHSLPMAGGRGRDEGVVLKEELLSGTLHAIRGTERTETKVSFFKGKDPSKWRTGLPAYAVVDLGEVCQGISVELRAKENNIEKLFFVSPGADPSDIRVRIHGADALSLNPAGELAAETGLGNVLFTKPEAFQVIGGRRISVAVQYTVRGNEYGFDVEGYNRKIPLVIDPLMASTFLGGGGTDGGFSLIKDGDDYLYVGGYTGSSDFPSTTGACYENFNGGDFDYYIAKFDRNLTTLLACTYLGGSDEDVPWAMNMAQGPDKNIYLVGSTKSTDFPTTAGVYQENYNGGACDLVIAKLDPDLTSLMAATYLGGGGLDGNDCLDFAMGPGGDLYVAGYTKSSNFPTTPGAYDESFNGFMGDGFITRLDPDLTAVLASTYLGGTSTDYLHGLDLDEAGNVYVAGTTSSANFPTTPGAYDEIKGAGDDGFLSRLDGVLTTLQASTFLGGTGGDGCHILMAWGEDEIYVTGQTDAPDFPTTPGAYDTTINGSWDNYVAKLDSNLSELSGSTFLGGSDFEFGHAMDVDAMGNVYLSGGTASTDHPVTPGAYNQTHNGDLDLFISKLDPGLKHLSASTFLGGSGWECCYFMTLEKYGEIFLTGPTSSPDFPVTPGSFCESYNGGDNDAFVMKFVLTGLYCDTYSLSAGQGGSIQFSLVAGTDQANREYLLLGGVSGTEPGCPLPGGQVSLPINWDGFTSLVAAWANAPLFTDFYGILNGDGNGTARLNTGPAPGCAGLQMNFAYVLNTPFDYVSNPVDVEVIH